MKIKLLKPMNPQYKALEQILVNRNIPHQEIYHYLNTTDKDINDPIMFGENIKKGAEMICESILTNKNALVVCDCDCDGFTSAALLINYLMRQFPT